MLTNAAVHPPLPVVDLERARKFIHEDLYVNSNGFVFDYHTGLTYTLNPVGVFIFKQLVEGTALAEIGHIIENKYGINSRIVTSDIDDFLQQLSCLNLLT